MAAASRYYINRLSLVKPFMYVVDRKKKNNNNIYDTIDFLTRR